MKKNGKAVAAAAAELERRRLRIRGRGRPMHGMREVKARRAKAPKGLPPAEEGEV